MNTAIRTTSIVIRLTGVILLLLGIVFWTGHALNLVPLHIGIGVVFVIALWALAGLGARAGVPAGFVALAMVWGLIVAALGMAQRQLLPGDMHWMIRLLHLLVGLAAMGIGDRVTALARIGPRRFQPRRPAVVGWPEGGGL